MRQIIVKLGHIQSVIAITAFSWLTSVAVTLFVVYWYARFGINLNIVSHLTIATLVPILLAPPISWYIIGLLLKIDQLEVVMRKAATFDSLTGLLNRHAFMEQGNYAFHLAKRERFGFSVLIVDIDHFKSINDEFGHASGDRVLETFGKIVVQIARKSDLVGRLGGEEFAFLLPNTSAKQAWGISERLHEAIKKTGIEHDGSVIRFTVSIGIVEILKDRVENIEKPLSMADKAMYQAKKNGRNQSAIYKERYKKMEAG